MPDRRTYFAEYHAARREQRNAAALARYHGFRRKLEREVRRILVTNTVRRLRAACRELGVQ